MNSNEIFEKARKLGLDTGSSINDIDNLKHLANQVGVEDLEELNSALDDMLNETNDDVYDNVNDFIDEQEISEPLDNVSNNNRVNSNNYSNRQEELNKKIDDLQKEKNTNTKDVVRKNENGEKVISQRQKNVFDKTKDNVNLLKAKNERFQNKITNAQNSMNNILHPTDAVKGKVKEVAKNAGKQVGKSAGKAASTAVKATGKAVVAGGKAVIAFLIANPIVAIIILVILFLILLILLIAGAADVENSYQNGGYYDTQCNYNETMVNLTSCNTTDSISLTIADYVIGMAHSYTNGMTYSDETLKALMVILKTNALSYGNYTSANKNINLDDCSKTYSKLNEIDAGTLSTLNNIYKLIEEEVYVSVSYSGTISSLNSSDALTFDESMLTEMESLSENLSYSQILEKMYPNTSNNIASNVNTSLNNSTNTNIFVGDSRMTFMKNYGIVTDDNSVYAGAMGYDWFVGNRYSKYSSATYNCKMNGMKCVSKKAGTSSNIILWLGVNDISNYEKYFSKYYELATGEWSNHTLYVVSVGYIGKSSRNEKIDIFNNYMRDNINASGLNNLRYIELGFTPEETLEGARKPSDTTHYNSEFSQKVYDRIIASVGGTVIKSGVKKIYKMSDFCSYYNLTGNTAYWWPIGSENPTGGNIYGGTPMETRISSKFASRVINGIKSNHKAIDIADGCKNTVLIAAKEGTVKKINNSCDNNGYYQNSCGGRLGNYVVIDHGDGVTTTYGHMLPNSITVKQGDKVVQGQKIGIIGNSGSSTGCHVHFAVKVNNVAVDPLEYVDPDNPRPVIVNTINGGGNVADGKNYVCNTLLNSGFSKNATIAVMINTRAESNFISTNLEGKYERSLGYTDETYTASVDNGTYNNFINDHAGYGLVQWTYHTRKEKLYNFAKSNNTSIGDIDMQLKFWLQELQNDYKEVYKYLNGNSTASGMSTYYCEKYENPAGSCSSRTSRNISEFTQYVNNGCK